MKPKRHVFVIVPIIILLIFGVSMTSFGFEKPAIKGKGSIPSSINKAKSKSVSPKDLKGKSIKIVKGTCCKNGELMTGQLTKTECEKKNRGTFYLSSSTAKKYCGFCCTQSGQVNSVEDSGDKGSCSKGGGTFYNTESKAESNCGWCLLKGKIFQVTNKKKECLGKGGTFYDTEVAAKKKLKENKGFCNVDGKTLLGLSAKECNKKKGKFYKIKGLAQTNLRKFKRKNAKNGSDLKKKPGFAKKGLSPAKEKDPRKIIPDPEMIPLERVAPEPPQTSGIPSLLDLEVVAMWSNDVVGESSRNHNVMVEIRNNGEAINRETALRIRSRLSSLAFHEPYFTDMPGAIGKGETIVLTVAGCEWTPWAIVNVTFTADVDNIVAEYNELNNVFSTEVGSRAGQPDLRVKAINYYERSVGDGLFVNCQIVNYGADLTDRSLYRNLKVRATFGDQSREISVESSSPHTVYDLNNGSLDVSFNSTIFDFDGRTTPLTIFVDSTGVIDESNEENNTKSVDVSRSFDSGDRGIQKPTPGGLIPGRF